MIDIPRAIADARQSDGRRKIEQAIELLESAAPTVDVISEVKIDRMVESLKGILNRNRPRVVLSIAPELETERA